MINNSKNPFISDGDSYVYNSDHSVNDENMSTSGTAMNLSDEGQYSIVRNEVRSTWPKRRPKYQKPHEYMNNEDFLASQIHLDSQNNSPINGSISDIICRDVDMNINNLKDSLATLTKRLEDADAEKIDKTNLERRLFDENSNLQSKVKNLELQINQTDLDAREDLEKMRQNNATELKRMISVKTEEIEECKLKASQLESETSNLRLSCLARKNEMEKLHYEIFRLKEKISINDQQYCILNEEVIRLKEINAKEMDIYTKEVDLVKKALLEIQEKEDSRKTNSEMLIPIAESQLMELQQFIQKLSQENRNLRENLEELQGDLLTLSLEEGRSLLNIEDNSWASESNFYTKAELVNYIIKENEVNYKLRQYTDKLISKIIEVDPSILEIF